MRNLTSARRKKAVYAPPGRKLTPVQHFDLRGLDQVSPYDVINDVHSPKLRNARMLSREDEDRKTAIATRKGPGFYTVPVGETADDSEVSVTGAADSNLTSVDWLAQDFTTTAAGILTKIELNLKNGTAPSGYIIVKVFTDNSGAPGELIAKSSIDGSDVGAAYAYLGARFIDAPALTISTKYWIVVHRQTGGSGDYNWSTTTNTTTGLTSGNSGGTWAALGASLNFKTYLSTDDAPIGLARWYPTTGTAKTLFAQGTAVYQVDDSDGSVSTIDTGLNAAATDYFFDFHEDYEYYVNNKDAPRKWDGTTASAVGGSPGVSRLMTVHKNRLFLVPSADPTKIIFSNLGDPDTYSATDYVFVPSPKSSDPIVQIISFQDALIIFTQNSKFVLYGNDLSDMVLREAIGKEGLVGPRALDKDDNFIYFVSNRGLNRWGGSQDEYLSGAVEPELSNVNNPEKVHVRIWNNQVRVYYSTLTSGNNDRMLLYDKTYKEWFMDTDVNVGMTVNLYKDDNKLVEASDLVGELNYAEQGYSNLGKPIDFQYWTKYHNFGDSSNKKQIKRFYPLFRSQEEPFEITVSVDKDLANSPKDFDVDTQGAGAIWGTMVWGSFTWGKKELIDPRLSIPGQAVYYQIRFAHNAVGQPVEILGYMMHARMKRPK